MMSETGRSVSPLRSRGGSPRPPWTTTDLARWNVGPVELSLRHVGPIQPWTGDRRPGTGDRGPGTGDRRPGPETGTGDGDGDRGRGSGTGWRWSLWMGGAEAGRRGFAAGHQRSAVGWWAWTLSGGSGRAFDG